MNAYRRDLLDIATEKRASGALDRRQFMKIAAALGAGATLPAATKGEFVMVNFGGAAVKAYHDAFAPAFERATGMQLVVDGSGASPAKIRAMVDSGSVVWDVCDYAPQVGIQLGGKYLEPIDYAIVDRAKVIDGFCFEYGVAAYVFSFVITYNKQTLPQAPATWRDFWDLKRFPGKRTLYKSPIGQLEAALLAAGIEPDKLYPINLDLALNKIKEIKSEIIFWDTGAQSLQLFRDREVVMGNIWNTRASLLVRDEPAVFDFTWNQAPLVVGGWAIPKGNPAGREASNRFIASAQDPAEQAELFKVLTSGAANPAAAALIPAELQRLNPTDPANIKLQARTSPQWWGENQDRVTDLWLDAIS